MEDVEFEKQTKSAKKKKSPVIVCFIRPLD